jgi:excisionase family DNA binding protein
METRLMTVKDLAAYLRLSKQTIQRYVLKKTIPFRKVQKVIHFRLSEIDAWVNQGGDCAGLSAGATHGDLFDDDMAGETAGENDKNGEQEGEVSPSLQPAPGGLPLPPLRGSAPQRPAGGLGTHCQQLKEYSPQQFDL